MEAPELHHLQVTYRLDHSNVAWSASLPLLDRIAILEPNCYIRTSRNGNKSPYEVV